MLLALLGCGGPQTSLEPDDTEATDPPGPSDTGGRLLDPDDPLLPPGTVGGPTQDLWETTLDFELELSDSAISSLRSDPDEEVEGTFVFGGREYSAGVHVKGRYSSRTIDQKPSLKLDFRFEDPEGEFLGLHHLTLNNMVQDSTMLHEHVAYRLYAMMGVPAPRHSYARLEINGDPYGLYGVVETMDEQLIDRVFPGDDEGNLYEGGYGGDFKSGNDRYFTLQESGDAVEPWQDLRDTIDVIVDTPSDAWLAMLDAHFARHALLRSIAIDLLIAHDDGYAHSANNYTVYNAPLAGRWTLMPWGNDQAFSGDEPVDGDFKGVLLAGCADDPACRRALDVAIEEVLATWETGELLAYATASADAIREDCEDDPRREKSCRQDSLLEFLAEHPAEIRAQLMP